MAERSRYIDLGGMTPIVRSIRVGATKPGQAGTELSGAEIAVLDGVTAGTVTASKAVVAGASSEVSGLGAVGATNLTLSGIVVGTPDVRTDDGAVSLTTLVTRINTTGAAALTLANGTAGQVKILSMGTDGGDATLTPATKTGYTTIVFNDAGDGCVLVYHTTIGWMVVGNFGCTIS